MQDKFWFPGSITINTILNSLPRLLKRYLGGFGFYCLKSGNNTAPCFSPLFPMVCLLKFESSVLLFDIACFSRCIRWKKELEHSVSHCHLSLNSVPHVLLINSPRGRLILRLFWDLWIQGNACIAEVLLWEPLRKLRDNKGCLICDCETAICSRKED